nr:CbtA family protein [uncultured Actinoplanes sp.]
MERRIIWRGILAGAAGGLLAFVFARVFAEPLIQQSIDYEDGRSHAEGALEHAHESFSRAVQGNVGMGVALIFFGAAMGALFAVAFALYLGRAGRLRPRTLALLVAGGGFLGMYLVPFLKYPVSPPAVGRDDTIEQRGTFYLLMVAASVLFLVLTVSLGKRLQDRFGTWNATLIAGAVFIAATAVVMLILPSFHETPEPLTGPGGQIVFPGFPADLLFGFRLYSVGAQLILWATIGLVFAPMAERLLGGAAARTAPAGV